MDSDWDIIGKEGLQFFGRISASISHEIKNILAIINENAGLLEDLALIAEKRKQVDIERFKTVAGKIRSQVVRADDIVKNLNRFAHSTDNFKSEVDLNDAVRFVAALCRRLFEMQGVSLELTLVDRSTVITTLLFVLQNVLWLCMSFAMEAAGDEKRVCLIVEKLESGAKIRFSNLRGIEKIPEGRFPSPKEKALLNATGARISFDASAGEFVLLLPDNIELR